MDKKIKPETRCPHCGGMLLPAIFFYHPYLAKYYVDFFHCFSCGREFHKEKLLQIWIKKYAKVPYIIGDRNVPNLFFRKESLW